MPLWTTNIGFAKVFNQDKELVYQTDRVGPGRFMIETHELVIDPPSSLVATIISRYDFQLGEIYSVFLTQIGFTDDAIEMWVSKFLSNISLFSTEKSDGGFECKFNCKRGI